MNRVVYIFLILMIIHSCKQNKDVSTESNQSSYSRFTHDDKKNVWDGEYCATISYYNPKTGKSSSYTLNIEVSNNELHQINWPNGGYMDDFFRIDFNEDGYTEFTSDKGYDYEVQITGDVDDCFEEVPMAVQCKGTTVQGEQCENYTDNQSGYCWQHEDQE